MIIYLSGPISGNPTYLDDFAVAANPGHAARDWSKAIRGDGLDATRPRIFQEVGP